MNFSRNIPFTITFLTVPFLFLAPHITAQEKACPVDLPMGLIQNKAG